MSSSTTKVDDDSPMIRFLPAIAGKGHGLLRVHSALSQIAWAQALIGVATLLTPDYIASMRHNDEVQYFLKLSISLRKQQRKNGGGGGGGWRESK